MHKPDRPHLAGVDDRVLECRPAPRASPRRTISRPPPTMFMLELLALSLAYLPLSRDRLARCPKADRSIFTTMGRRHCCPDTGRAQGKPQLSPDVLRKLPIRHAGGPPR